MTIPVLCGESEEDLRVMAGRSVNVCRRRGLKVNADKRKVMVLNGEEGLECELYVHGTRLGQFSECVLDESGTDGSEWEEGCRCHYVPS